MISAPLLASTWPPPSGSTGHLLVTTTMDRSTRSVESLAAPGIADHWAEDYRTLM